MRSPNGLRAVVALLILFQSLAFTPFVSAQDTTDRNPSPDDESASSSDLLELAALVLLPSDLDEPGFGIVEGYYTSLKADSRFFNSMLGGSDDDLADVTAQLEEAKWQQSYFYQLGIASGDDPSFYATRVSNSFIQFEEEDGAAEGFDLWREALASSGYLKATGGEKVGDESALTRYSGTFDDGSEYRILDMLFRSGTVVVEVYITEYIGDQPPVETVQHLADILYERVSEATPSSGPGLSFAALKLTGNNVRTDFTYYDRLNGEQIAPFGRPIADVRADDRYYDDLGVTDSLLQGQTLYPSADDTETYGSFWVYLYKTEGDDAAAGLIEVWRDAWVENPAAGFSDVEIVRRAEVIGEESIVLTQVHERSDGTTAAGYRIYARIGSTVLFVSAEYPDGVQQKALESAAEAAADCVDSGGPCEPIPIPRNLF